MFALPGKNGAVLVLALLSLALSIIGCDSIAENLCLVESQDKIEWEQKPEIQDDYLVASGSAKEGALLIPGFTITDAAYDPAMTLSFWSDDEFLVQAGIVWPSEMEESFSADGLLDSTDYFAEPDGYKFTDTEFAVRAKLDERLLNDGRTLAVALWGNDIENPLGVECIER